MRNDEKSVWIWNNLNCCGLMGILETSWNPWWSARFINDGGESCLMMLMELSWLAIGNSRLFAVLHYELIFVFLALANFQTISGYHGADGRGRMPLVDFRGIGIPSGYLTMENGPFVDGLPIKDADFPTAMSNNQMVYGKYIGNLEIEQDWTS